MANVLRTVHEESPNAEPRETGEIAAIRSRTRPSSADYPGLYNLAEMLLLSLQHQLAVLAKSAHLAGKVDIARHAKVTLNLSAKIRTKLDMRGTFPAHADR